MVFIEDEEDIDSPIDKVWNLAQAHFTEGIQDSPGG